MPQRIAIIGAGIIGAMAAYHLTRRGQEVTVFDAGLPGQGASGRSFGWINASYFADDAHHHLRRSGMEAWRRLKADLPDLALHWPGALSWDATGSPLVDQAQALSQLGYPVEILTGAALRGKLSGLANVPDQALFFPAEGAAETGQVVAQVLGAAQIRGAKVIAGTPVTALQDRGGRITDVVTPHGTFATDQVLITAGTGAAGILAGMGVQMPMLKRPGVLMRSQPLPPMLDQILVIPDLELRQDSTGRLLFPTSPNHQADSADGIADLSALIHDAEARLHNLLPGLRPKWDQAFVANRPVPGDGLPAVGAIGPKGLTVAVMHSGATLAPIIAEYLAEEMLGDTRAPMLAPYRPDRFQTL